MSLPENVHVSELGDGLRVVTEHVPNFRSVALGMWARTGSRDEELAEAGISHFLEHLLFKGTDRHSAIEISELFDSMGAASNAATSKESTHLHARFLDEHLPDAFELMADMFMRPALPAGEIDSERDVVLEEIAMYEDEPSDRVHDVLAEAIYGSHPLGRRVLGSAEVIASVPIDQIAAYHRERYSAGNVVVSAAGNVEHAAVVELAERLLADAGSADPRAAAPAPGADPRFRFQAKDTEQFHICFGGHGIARGDERRFALAVLDTIFGGAVSSRLFREIREKRGLAYSVGSYSEQFVDRGAVAMYVGTRAENVAEACEIIGRELRSLGTEGVSAGELERAKEHIKGRMVLSLESTGARMSRLARAVLFDLPVQSLDELIAQVEAVTLDDVAELAAELYDPAGLSAACIGADEDVFRSAVGAVEPALATA